MKFRTWQALIVSFLVFSVSHQAPAAGFLSQLGSRLAAICSWQSAHLSSNGYRIAQSRVKTDTSHPDNYYETQNLRAGDEIYGFYFNAYLHDKRILKLNIKLVDHAIQKRSQIRGRDALSRALNHIGMDRVQMIEAQWHPSGDNHESFMKALLSGVSPADAALGTSEEPEAPLIDLPMKAIWSADNNTLILSDDIFGFELGFVLSKEGIKTLLEPIIENQYGKSLTLDTLLIFAAGINMLISEPNSNEAERTRLRFQYTMRNISNSQIPETGVMTTPTLINILLSRYESTFAVD